MNKTKRIKKLEKQLAKANARVEELEATLNKGELFLDDPIVHHNMLDLIGQSSKFLDDAIKAKIALEQSISGSERFLRGVTESFSCVKGVWSQSRSEGCLRSTSAGATLMMNKYKESRNKEVHNE